MTAAFENPPCPMCGRPVNYRTSELLPDQKVMDSYSPCGCQHKRSLEDLSDREKQMLTVLLQSLYEALTPTAEDMREGPELAALEAELEEIWNE